MNEVTGRREFIIEESHYKYQKCKILNVNGKIFTNIKFCRTVFELYIIESKLHYKMKTQTHHITSTLPIISEIVLNYAISLIAEVMLLFYNHVMRECMLHLKWHFYD